MTTKEAISNALRAEPALEPISELPGFELRFRNTHPQGSDECLTVEPNLEHKQLGFNVYRRYLADGTPDEPGWCVRVRARRRSANGKPLWCPATPEITSERIAALKHADWDSLAEALFAAFHPETTKGLHGGCPEMDRFRAEVLWALVKPLLA